MTEIITIPPQELLGLTGSSDVPSFIATGKKFSRIFIDICNLKPHEKVLEVGCGVGRIALPLTDYLDSHGSYEGFDINAEQIHWCQNQITSQYLNFHFKLVDVYNQFYNPLGAIKAQDLQFPCLDDSFDFIFLTSLFTHMLPADMENYISEIARVLKHGKKLLVTFYLLNHDSLARLQQPESDIPFKFRHHFGHYHLDNPAVPEAAIAYDEQFIRSLYAKYGLEIVEPIHYGKWCGRENCLSWQDIAIAIKAS